MKSIKFFVVVMTITVLLMVVSSATANDCSRRCVDQKRRCFRSCATSDNSCIDNCATRIGKCFNDCLSGRLLRRDEDLLPERFPEIENGFY